MGEQPPDPAAAREFLEGLQARICSTLERLDGQARFSGEEIGRPGGGLSRPRVLEAGRVFEKAAVHFTHTTGRRLPAAATDRRPELAGKGYEAISVSLIVHPLSPYVPTSHANYRFFLAHDLTHDLGRDLARDLAPERAQAGSEEPVWWFGGGFDCTPYYGFEEDAIHWHRTARAACEVHSPGLYARFKRQCDEYFYLPHRDEPRGIGGLFYDDFDEGGFARAFALWKSTADAYLDAYVPIVERRRDRAWGERERAFQLYRRGRYAEFNLLYDRGTRFGLESGARTESVLASMPPLVAWRYDWLPEPDSPEAALTRDFLRPRDWAAMDPPTAADGVPRRA